MGFVKCVKNKAYYKRLQVKYRRRKCGKTDYQARRNMVKQDKNKYNTPKYRLVVRITNKKFICQIVYSTIMGDRTICQATSAELTNFDIPIGHTNYAAGYCTGLLIARRCLKKMGLDQTFQGKETLDAEEYHVEEEMPDDVDRNPFKVILDVGTIRTIMGSRVFGVLKGAVDGGLHIPHTIKKFPGYEGPEERFAESKYEAAVHQSRILGEHLREYLELLDEEDQEKYKSHFSKFIENEIDAEKIEDMYTEAHSKIREDPEYKPEEKTEYVNKRQGNYVVCDDNKYERKVKKSKQQRHSYVAQKIKHAQTQMLAAAGAGDDDDEDEE